MVSIVGYPPCYPGHKRNFAGNLTRFADFVTVLELTPLSIQYRKRYNKGPYNILELNLKLFIVTLESYH
ncbi:hypothetical protein PGT21_012056 [Puccinia graminis f. sp. tritici]|uniref:Uncharacterized protein n=1 Tax=Puccinia graminis f. sp. tritici TaxID=56615 RepID=A0A5B0SA02_PUCGR|nr:hypothetical protein PGT21_012056 [Puccinia graminis f. sp. tritici]KAA1134044.1 hypothetical protein PGTUg99_020841 [Puccinia graminis f. sp. tritici]KAA1134275.1 hypothetical protein PGTUg99_034438 [Puccinia graminis f. sp. tritici]